MKEAEGTTEELTVVVNVTVKVRREGTEWVAFLTFF
jgi:hypothetical protein